MCQHHWCDQQSTWISPLNLASPKNILFVNLNQPMPYYWKILQGKVRIKPAIDPPLCKCVVKGESLVYTVKCLQILTPTSTHKIIPGDHHSPQYTTLTKWRCLLFYRSAYLALFIQVLWKDLPGQDSHFQLGNFFISLECSSLSSQRMFSWCWCDRRWRWMVSLDEEALWIPLAVLMTGVPSRVCVSPVPSGFSLDMEIVLMRLSVTSTYSRTSYKNRSVHSWVDMCYSPTTTTTSNTLW